MELSSWGYLSQWAVSQLDGDWEHEHGIKLELLDNPGWLLSVDVLVYESILIDVSYSHSFTATEFVDIRIKDSYLYISTGMQGFELLPQIFCSLVKMFSKLQDFGEKLRADDFREYCSRWFGEQ